MVIIANLAYPAESAPEVAKRFLAAPKIPEFITRRGPFVNSTLSDGIVAVSLFEFDKSRLSEVMESLGNYFASFIGAPGFKYEVKPFFHVEEALKMIGMG